MSRSKLKKQEITEIFERFHQAEPNPRGELNSVNDFTFLVAVVLSAQATDISVNKATKTLFQIADTPEKMLRLGLTKLENHIRTIGLYKSKARNVMQLCEQLIAQHNSEVPSNLSDLMDLAGVGRKTANVVLNQIYGQPTIAVDTHLFRLGNRTGLAPGKTPLEVEKTLSRVIPDDFKHHAHHWLILHGRYICLARKPRCGLCLISDLCKFKNKTE
jgi:endonuclease III